MSDRTEAGLGARIRIDLDRCCRSDPLLVTIGLVASLLTPPVLWALGERQMAEMSVILTLLLWWKHRENIKRLLSGSEGKIGQKQ